MRVSWDTYFMDIASLVSVRATCERLKVGSVVVKENKVISTGYNGSPLGEEHCIDVGCLMDKGSCIRTIHSELNAIMNSVKNGVDIVGSVIYVTHFPCYNCAKHIVQAGIKEVVYKEDYRNKEEVYQLFKSSGVRYRKYEG